jgi:hypothetical protein
MIGCGAFFDRDVSPMNLRLLILSITVFELALRSAPCHAQAFPQEQQLETCTLLGCHSSAGISIRLPNGQAPDFDIEITFDGNTISCLASDAAENGLRKYCGDVDLASDHLLKNGVRVAIREVAACKPTVSSKTAGQEDCTDKKIFEEYLQISAAPREIELTLKRGGQTIVEKVFRPEYALHYPNSERCGDPCEYWRTNWVVEGGR